MTRPCECCGDTGVALFAAAGAGGGPPVVRCGRCIERLGPWARVWLQQSGLSVPGSAVERRRLRAELVARRWVTEVEVR